MFNREFAMLEEHTLQCRNHSDIPLTDSFVAAARATLRGHHVLFVGDSVTRCKSRTLYMKTQSAVE